MSAINNLNGTIITDGKIVYSEKIENDLYFAIILKYDPFSDPQNTLLYKHSSKLMCEAVMTTGNKHTYGNGVIVLDDALIIETADENGNFKPLREELKTKDGFRIWQKDYAYSEYQNLINDNIITIKIRRVIWLVEVPKLNLLQYCT